MKLYKLYFTRSLETLQDEIYLGEALTIKEACALANKEIDSHNFDKSPYWRWFFNSEGAFIDFGAWSPYLAIIGATKEEAFG